MTDVIERGHYDMPLAPKGFVACRTLRGPLAGRHRQVTHLVMLDAMGSNRGRPTLCGLTRFDRFEEDGRRVPGTADLPGWSMGDGGLFGPDVEQVACPDCWREANR